MVVTIFNCRRNFAFVPVFFALDGNVFDFVWRPPLIGRRLDCSDFRFHRLARAGLTLQLIAILSSLSSSSRAIAPLNHSRWLQIRASVQLSWLVTCLPWFSPAWLKEAAFWSGLLTVFATFSGRVATVMVSSVTPIVEVSSLRANEILQDFDL